MKSKKRSVNQQKPTQSHGPNIIKVPENLAAVIVDHNSKQIALVDANLLLNQLFTVSPVIESSFDRLCMTDLEEISQLQSATASILYAGFRPCAAAEPNLYKESAKLLLNASNSVASAVSLLRMGYLLQPGIILRSVFEAISTVYHLLQHPKDLEKFRDGRLSSPSTVAAAKHALPPFGRMYGYLSENFAHIGHLHRSLNKVEEYSERHSGLKTNLGFIRITAWLLYVVTELLFYKLMGKPRYWIEVDNGFKYAPSEEEQTWMSSFLGSADA